MPSTRCRKAWTMPFRIHSVGYKASPDRRVNRRWMLWHGFSLLRQLTINELCCALSIRVGDKQFVEEGLPTLKSLLESCLGLIIIDKGTLLLRLVHKSLQDFFEDEFNKKEIFLNGHQDIALTCLTYMNFAYEFHREEYKLTLANYAIQIWGHHVRKSRPGYAPDWAKITASIRDCAKIAQVFYPSDRGLIQRPFSDSDLIYIPIFLDWLTSLDTCSRIARLMQITVSVLY